MAITIQNRRGGASDQIGVRISEQQKEEIAGIAAAKGISLSRFARLAILEKLAAVQAEQALEAAD
jgi:predicted HicB family RNase H-like nuclease